MRVQLKRVPVDVTKPDGPTWNQKGELPSSGSVLHWVKNNTFMRSHPSSGNNRAYNSNCFYFFSSTRHLFNQHKKTFSGGFSLVELLWGLTILMDIVVQDRGAELLKARVYTAAPGSGTIRSLWARKQFSHAAFQRHFINVAPAS